MRIAVVSDVHGNFGAFKAVLADLRSVSPDLVLHGGDLADSGSSPVEIVDCMRDLGWQGVLGNTDEMLICPRSLEEFAKTSNAPVGLWNVVREIAAATRDALGPERLAWLGAMPRTLMAGPIALVHASAGSCWHNPSQEASDTDLREAFESDQPALVFGHTHRPFVRQLAGSGQVVINTGSVGLSYDGDPRASYLLLDEELPSIRRIEYDVEAELRRLQQCRLPGAAWTAKMLLSGRPQMP